MTVKLRTFLVSSLKHFNLTHSVKLSTRSSTVFTKHECSEADFEATEKLYEGHIPTTLFQKVLLTIGSSLMSITDLYRHDMIAVMGETTGYYAAKKIRDKMLNDPEGRTVLEEQPRINSNTLDYDYLKSLPADTLGHAYMSFLQNHVVTPDSRRLVTFVDDAEIAYVIQRYREVHDLNHTLLGMPTNLIGELAIKWVEAIQTGFPMCISAAVAGPIRLKKKQREKYIKSYLPWAIKCGHEAAFLMNIYYEKRWDQNLSDLKRELNIPEFPTDCG